MKPTSKLKQIGARAPRFLGSASLTMALASIPLTAETGEAANATQSSEVVELTDFIVRDAYLYNNQVNALKTPTPILDVPQSLSVFNSDEIEERGFNSIGDIVDYTPGVNTSQGEGHRDAVVFRGVRSTADFFVDGVRDDVQYYRPLYNVDQVEILRGPNALFFGRGGTGGVLNRVMKKGQLGSDFNDYFLSVDSFGAYEAQIDSNMVIRENGALRINAHYESLENHRDFYEGERFGVTPTFKFELGEATTLDVAYEYMDHERFIDRGIPTGADGEPVEAFKDIVFGDPDINESTLQAHVIRALLQHRFSDELKGNLSLSYGDYDKYYANFYASAYDEVATPNEVTLDGYVDTTDRQNFILSGNLIGEFETGDMEHTVIVGAEYVDTASDQDRFNPDFDPGPGTQDTQTFTISDRSINGVGFNAGGLDAGPFTDLNDSTQSNLEVYSLFFQDEIQLLQSLQLVLGGRFDSFQLDVSGTGNGSQTDEQFSPRGGLVFKPQENISLYASYSQSFLPQSGEQYANLGGASRGLDPDEFTNLEAGLKWDFRQGLSFTASVFEIQEDAIVPTGGGGSQVQESETRGFETQVQGQLTDQWSISAGYSYLDSELPNGNTTREVPEHSVTFWNTYQLSDDLGLGLGMIYQDDSFINNANTATLPGYVRVDAAAYYQISENLRLQLNIENLTDELYFPNAHSTHQATVGAPINARLALSGRF